MSNSSSRPQRANHPSAGLGSSLAGIDRGFSVEERRCLSRVLLKGIGRDELSAVALAVFCRISQRRVASLMKLTPAHLADLLNSFHVRVREHQRKIKRESGLARRNELLEATRARQITCLECFYINQWLPGDGADCAECGQPLTDKFLHGQAVHADPLHAAKATGQRITSQRKGLNS